MGEFKKKAKAGTFQYRSSLSGRVSDVKVTEVKPRSRARRRAIEGKAEAKSKVVVSAAQLVELRRQLEEVTATAGKLADIVNGLLSGEANSTSAEDAAEEAAVVHVRNQIAAGAEEVIPAEVVKRLDVGESPVRVFRELRGMTQGQLAAAIEVDQSFISKIEAGTKHPTAANLGRLARVLKIDADLLLPDD
ncbi:MAG: helix-turn-helix domain-containing protein [Kiloniellaceae bacterium]|nr:helix-turn-helix domain-containing protein [Kiloniellaceae bacterium]